MNTQKINELTINKALALIEAYRLGEFDNAESAILEGIKLGLTLAREIDEIDDSFEDQFMKDQMLNAQEVL